MDSSTGARAPLPPLNLCFSDDGLHAVHTSGRDLILYSKPDSEPKEPDSERNQNPGLKIIKFSSINNFLDGLSTKNQCLLTVDRCEISVWQLHPLKVFARIKKDDSDLPHIDFGGNQDEILIFASWGQRLTVYALDSSQETVIKLPKFAHSLGYGYRPRTGQLAALLKPDASDILTIHEYRSYKLLNRAVLPTVDAQGLKWSPDGKWIAVWELASAGTKVLIFTADGQLFRTYTGPSGVDDAFDLGVKQIEWSPAPGEEATSHILAVGKVSGNIDLLRTRTFSSSTTLSHVFQTDQHPPKIWRERYTDALGDAEYAEASISSAFNMSPESSGPPRGVSHMTFSPDGTLLATVDSMRPNVVWIWSLDATPRLASALVHEQPVRQLAWHPKTSQLLINTVTNALPAIRWWSPQSHPVIARVPTKTCETGRYEVKWLSQSQGHVHDSAFWFGSAEEYMVGYLSDEEGVVHFKAVNTVTNTRAYGSQDHARSWR